MTDAASKADDAGPAAPSGQSGPEPPPPAMIDFRAMHAELGALFDKQLFFIGGAAKSGTTWLQVLLDAHPDVSCTGENHFVTYLFRNLRKTLEEHNRVLLDPRKNTAYAIGWQPALFEADEFVYLAIAAALGILRKQARAKPAARAIGDKTPENVRVFPQLFSWFPRSKGFHMVRDPRDGAVSGWHHVTRLFPEETKSVYPGIDDYARKYAKVWAIKTGDAATAAAQFPTRILELRYEELIETPEPILARAFRFLDIESDPALVARCIKAASFEGLSGGRTRGQELVGSFFRKGVVGDWQTRLAPETIAYVLAECGDGMRRFGYL